MKKNIRVAEFTLCFELTPAQARPLIKAKEIYYCRECGVYHSADGREDEIIPKLMKLDRENI